MMILMLFSQILPVAISKKEQVKAILPIAEVLEAHLALNKVKPNGNRETSRRDTKRVTISFSSSPSSQEQDQHLVVPKLKSEVMVWRIFLIFSQTLCADLVAIRILYLVTGLSVPSGHQSSTRKSMTCPGTIHVFFVKILLVTLNQTSFHSPFP